MAAATSRRYGWGGAAEGGMAMSNKTAFAEIWGSAIGDGWIGRGNRLCLFISGDPTEDKSYYDEHIPDLFRDAFDFSIRPIEFRYWKTYGITTSRKAVISRLLAADFPVGKKRDIRVPDEILCHKELFISMIRGLFDTDGTIYFQKSYNKTNGEWERTHHYIPKIRISSISENHIRVLKTFAEKYVGIKCHIERSGKTKTAPNVVWHLSTSGKVNIERWMEVVQPKNFKHVSKYLVWKKLGYHPPNTKLSERKEILSR
jgi:hypothetical protein